MAITGSTCPWWELLACTCSSRESLSPDLTTPTHFSVLAELKRNLHYHHFSPQCDRLDIRSTEGRQIMQPRRTVLNARGVAEKSVSLCARRDGRRSVSMHAPPQMYEYHLIDKVHWKDDDMGGWGCEPPLHDKLDRILTLFRVSCTATSASLLLHFGFYLISVSKLVVFSISALLKHMSHNILLMFGYFSYLEHEEWKWGKYVVVFFSQHML